MTEQAIQRSIAAFLDVALPRDVFYTAVNPVPSKGKAVAGISKAMGMKAGVPDIVLCANGKFIGLEVKKEGEYLRPTQRHIHQRIKDAGGKVYTVRSIEDVEEVLAAVGVGLKGSIYG